jgi:hypothetical protein
MHKPTPDASFEERELWIRGKYEYKVGGWHAGLTQVLVASSSCKQTPRSMHHPMPTYAWQTNER